MPELFLDIKLGLEESSKQTVRNELKAIQDEAQASSRGGAKAINTTTSAIKRQERAQKALNDKFVRLKNLNEVRFRQGKISQEQAIRYSNLIEEAAQNQGILNDNTKRGVQFQKQMQLSQQRITTGFTGMAQVSTRANQSLMNLGRIVQDLPFGFLGISNNIDPALNSFRSLNDETGGLKGTFKELLGALKGTGGLVFALGSLLPTAVLLAQKGFNMYRKSAKKAEESTIKLREESEVLADAVKSGIGAFTDSIGQDTINVLEEALRQFDPEVNGSKLFKADVDAIIEGLSDFNATFGDDGVRIVQNESGEIVRETVDSIRDAISESEEINELVEKELKNRLAVAQAEQKIAEARARLSLFRPDESLLDIEDVDIEIPEFVDPQAEQREEFLVQATERNAQRAIAIDKIAFETRLAQANDYQQKVLKLRRERMKNEQMLVDAGLSRDRAIEMSGVLFNEEMNNLEIEQTRKTEEEKTRILKAEEERRKKIRMQALDSTFGLASNIVGSLIQLNQTQTDETEAQARKRFEQQKKLQKAQAVISGASAIVKTFSEWGYPFGIPFAAAQAAATAIQLRAIEQTTFNSAGSGSSVSSQSQSGFFETDAQGRPQNEPAKPTMGMPQPVIILEGEFDDEVVSVKARRGEQKRKRATLFPQ